MSKLRRALDETVDDLLLEVLGEDIDLIETWSDAARAASIAARRARAKGGDWRGAARDAFYQTAGRPKTSPTERNMAIAKASADWHSGGGSRVYRMGSRAQTALAKLGISSPIDSFDRLDRGTKGKPGRYKYLTPGTKAQHKYFSRKFAADNTPGYRQPAKFK